MDMDTRQIENLKKERDVLLDWIKNQPPSNLSKELLLIRLSDAEHQLNDITREVEKDKKYYMELEDKERELEEIKEKMWGEEINNEAIEDLKKQLNDMMDTANDLQACLTKEKEDNDSLRKKLHLKKKGDDSSDEELEDGKRKAYDDFIDQCCQWNARRIKQRCMDTKKMHEVAAGSTEQLYKNFKEWAMVNELVLSKGKSKLLPSKDQFSRWCVEDHKNRYPMDWRQNGMPFPLSPNGSHQTPRVNLHLINDPSTGEKLYKHGLNN